MLFSNSYAFGVCCLWNEGKWRWNPPNIYYAIYNYVSFLNYIRIWITSAILWHTETVPQAKSVYGSVCVVNLWCRQKVPESLFVTYEIDSGFIWHMHVVTLIVALRQMKVLSILYVLQNNILFDLYTIGFLSFPSFVMF